MRDFINLIFDRISELLEDRRKFKLKMKENPEIDRLVALLNQRERENQELREHLFRFYSDPVEHVVQDDNKEYKPMPVRKRWNRIRYELENSNVSRREN